MAAVAPLPEPVSGWGLDFGAPPLDVISPDTERQLKEKYEQMGKSIEEQQLTLQKLMQAQHSIEEAQHKALVEERKMMEERFDRLDKKLGEQVSLVTSVQQQQQHIMRLISIQDKLAEQDRQLRMFFDYQQQFLSTLQGPMAAQAETFRSLHENQARMMQALSSVHMPMPASLPDFSMSYAIPANLGELPKPGPRSKKSALVVDPTTKYTNVAPVLGGMKPFPHFDADDDAKHLRKAMKGLGTDERVVVTVLGNRTNAQRQLVAQAYRTNYKRDLVADIRSDTSGHFAHVLVGLLQLPDVFDAHSLYNAIQGLGTNDRALIEVLCTRTNQQIKAIKAAYKKEFSRELEGDVRGDTSGDYQNLLLAVLRAQRDESTTVDMAKVKEDAAALHNAGEAKVGTNEQVFISIFTQRNYAHLRAVADQYSKIEDFDLEKSISRETSFNFRKALVTILKFALSPPDLFAELLHEAMYGVGTNHDVIVRIMVSRSEVDLKDISVSYKRLFKQSLVHRIRTEVGGDYRRIILELFGDEGFNPEMDAKALRRALKGWRVSGSTLNKVLSRRTGQQRQAIKEAYMEMYKRDLVKDICARTMGDYQELLVALLTPADEFTAREAWRTMKGIGTDDNSLIEIICSRNGFQMRTLKETYSRIHGRDLAGDVRGDTSGSYQRLLLSLVEQERDDKEAVDIKAALAEASRLFRAGEERLGTDEDVFIEVLCRHSLEQLAVILEQYNKLCEYDIEKSISRETSFNFKRALLAIVLLVRDPAKYFAQRLHATMAGVGTQDRNLIRIMVQRSEMDLRSINDAYFQTYKKTLESTIHDDTSGNYRHLLLCLLERARATNPVPTPTTAAAAALANIPAVPEPAPAGPAGVSVTVLAGPAKGAAGAGSGPVGGAAAATPTSTATAGTTVPRSGTLSSSSSTAPASSSEVHRAPSVTITVNTGTARSGSSAAPAAERSTSTSAPRTSNAPSGNPASVTPAPVTSSGTGAGAAGAAGAAAAPAAPGRQPSVVHLSIVGDTQF